VNSFRVHISTEGQAPQPHIVGIFQLSKTLDMFREDGPLDVFLEVGHSNHFYLNYNKGWNGVIFVHTGPYEDQNFKFRVDFRDRPQLPFVMFTPL